MQQVTQRQCASLMVQQYDSATVLKLYIYCHVTQKMTKLIQEVKDEGSYTMGCLALGAGG